MGFKKTVPYTQYKTRGDEVTLQAKTGRHGTMKAMFELGEDVLKGLGLTAGDHYVDMFVGTGDDCGIVRFQKGTCYKIRAMRNGRNGLIVVPATAVGLTKKQPRVHCGHEADSSRRIYVIVTRVTD